MTNIDGIARALREECGTGDPFAICEMKRIGVLFCDLPVYVKGFYLKMDANRIIFINQEIDEQEARLTCSHELGHAMLHSDYNAMYLQTQTLMNCGRYEAQADTFGACLLIDEDVFADSGETVTEEEIARRSGVPERWVTLWLEEKRERAHTRARDEKGEDW